MRRRSLLLGAAAAVSTACLRSLRTPTSRSAGPTLPASKLAAHPGRGMWPQQVAEAPPNVQDAYHWAVANEASLRYIPCYCGCGASGHRDNFDCYVDKQLDGGWLVLSDHALG